MENLWKTVLSLLTILFLWQIRGFLNWFRIYLYHQWAVRKLPGPSNLPIIGSAHLFKGLYGFPEFLLRETDKVIKNGEGIMRVWVGPILRIYLFDPDIVKIVTNSTVELHKGRDYERFHPWLGKNGLLTSTGDEEWRTNRKLLTPAFHFGKLEEYAAVIDQHARELVSFLNNYTDGNQHDIFQFIKSMSLDTIAETAMGIELNNLQNPDNNYIKSVDTFSYFVFFRGAVPIYLNKLIWKLSGYKKLEDEALEILKSTSGDVIRKRIQILESGLGETKKKPDFLDILLEAYKQGRMSFEQIHQEVDTFLFAGYDTTSHAISWILWALASNPLIQDKLYNEINEKFDDDSDFSTNKIKDLPYFDAVIKEGLRAYPPIAVVGRFLQNDLKIGKYNLPKGSTAWISILALHHNEKTFPNHWTFDPENFLNNKEYPPNAYLPFSAGLRNCIGQKFAMREIRIVLAHLIYNFRFTTDYQMTDNKPVIKVVMSPTLGVPVRIQPRI